MAELEENRFSVQESLQQITEILPRRQQILTRDEWHPSDTAGESEYDAQTSLFGPEQRKGGLFDAAKGRGM